MTKFNLTLLILSLIFSTFGLNFDSEGTDFIFAFPELHVASGGQTGTSRVILTSRSAARATVEVAGQSISHSVSISANGEQVVDLPSTVRQTGGATQTLAVTVKSDKPIAVYAVNQAEQATDGTIIFPTSMLGTEYILASFPGAWFGSQVSVVSRAAGTTVTLWKPDFINGHIVDSTVTLNSGETHLFQTTTADLTGWKITSTSEIAVLSGHSLTQVPSVSTTVNSTSSGLNQYSMQASHLWEMLPPTNLWDTEFAIPPTPLRTLANKPHSHIRVIGNAATAVTRVVQNVTLSIAQTGEYISFNMSLNEYELIQCDVGCIVVFYTTDFQYDSTSNTDASMTVVPPTTASHRGDYVLGAIDVNAVAALAVNRATFAWNNYIIVITPTSYATSVAVTASSTLSATFTQMNNTLYSYATFGPVNAASNTAVTVSCTECFSMMIGLQFSDSYAYVGSWKSKSASSSATALFSGSLVVALLSVWTFTTGS